MIAVPRISVLMPCFNHGAFLDDALGSVHCQTFQDFEVVVVDDGSTDPLTVERLTTLDAPRTRVVRTPNRGLPAARNTAAAEARGELFCALDADDRLAPSWFEKAVGLLDMRPQVAFVSHWLETFGDEHWTWQPERCDLPSLLARNTVNGAALVRRQAFEAVGGYDESMRDGCEDWDFWLRLVQAGYQGTIIPEVLFFYRRRSESMSRVMTGGDRYEGPLGTLVARHEPQYRKHLIDVLVSKEDEAVRLLKEIGDLERDRLTVLAPALARAGEELCAIEAKVTRLRPAVEADMELRRLAARSAELEREVAALRGSWSWRATRPARRVYSWLTGRP